MRDVSVPVLQIQGHQDPYGSAAQLSAIENGSSAQVTTQLLDECGHSPYREQADSVLSHITEFVADPRVLS